LLRVFVILKRGLRPVIVMDETLAAIEGEYIVQMASFLSTLSERFGFDILLITHDPRLVDCSDHAYRIVNKNGKATYKKLK
jgi:ABC-type thiamine transport system ATPase subunit